jgi:ubiquinone/menaquinone biosynthesis C-methylase UbiE
LRNKVKKLILYLTIFSVVVKKRGDNVVKLDVVATNCDKNPKEEIAAYWTERADSFTKLRAKELHSEKHARWEKEILGHLPVGEKLKVLDVGCGSGFFSILLAQNGHNVTGIDLTENMIMDAQKLADKEGVSVLFQVMDAEKLAFSNHNFDLVISRNLTWTLPNPEQAYKEWLRVLKPGGLLLNYDAEYAGSRTERLQVSNAHQDLPPELLEQCRKIYNMLAISDVQRPKWDQFVLAKLNKCLCQVDLQVGERIYKEKDEFYISVPMFGIVVTKNGLEGECIDI